MATLPQLTNAIILLDIKGNRYEAKALTLDDLAEAHGYEEKIKQQSTSPVFINVKRWLYCLYLALKKQNPDITLEYVNELFAMSEIEELKKIGVQVGFLDTPAAKKEPETTEPTKNQQTGDTSLPESQPEPATTSEPSAS